MMLHAPVHILQVRFLYAQEQAGPPSRAEAAARLNQHYDGGGGTRIQNQAAGRDRVTDREEAATMSESLIPRARALSISCKCQALGYALMNDGYPPCLFYSSSQHPIIEWAPARAQGPSREATLPSSQWRRRLNPNRPERRGRAAPDPNHHSSDTLIQDSGREK